MQPLPGLPWGNKTDGAIGPALGGYALDNLNAVALFL